MGWGVACIRGLVEACGGDEKCGEKREVRRKARKATRTPHTHCRKINARGAKIFRGLEFQTFNKTMQGGTS